MRGIYLSLFFSLFMGLFSSSQTDSVLYSPELVMNDGVYLTYSDFRKNKSIPKEQIQSKIKPEQLDFLTRVMEQEQLSYEISKNKITLPCKEVWGYVQNGTFYINYKGKFYRIPVFGSISFLVAMVEVQITGYYDPRFGTTSSSYTTTESREFLMNFYDGQLIELKMDEADKLLSRDKSLYAEYSKLSTRKQKEQLYRFIRKFNELHPVYFLK